MIRQRLLIVLLICGCLSPVLSASVVQDHVDVEWVLVPVVVSKGTRPVRGLEARDFELTVDGQPVTIDSFEASVSAPVSWIHLQDLSGSMELDGRLTLSREVLSCFLRQARPGDELALASFASGEVRLDVPFTTDVSALDQVAEAWRGYGSTALHDAVAWLPELSDQNHGLRRAALLITDGVDNASSLSAAQARDLVRRAQLPVYVLGLKTGSPFELHSQGGKLYSRADMLNLLAHYTGGRYHSILPTAAAPASQHLGSADVESLCAAIDQELRSQYVLSFAAGADGPKSYRSIRVKVPGRNLEVRHRLGYSGRRPAGEADP